MFPDATADAQVYTAQANGRGWVVLGGGAATNDGGCGFVEPPGKSHELVRELVDSHKNVQSAGLAPARSADFVRDRRRQSASGLRDSGVSFAQTPSNASSQCAAASWSAVALPAPGCRSSLAVVGGVVQQLTFAGSSSGTSRLVTGSGSGSTPSCGASRYEKAGESRVSAALVARKVETSDEIRGTIGVAFTASTTEAPAAPGGAWASAARLMCGALDAGTILTATRAPA